MIRLLRSDKDDHSGEAAACCLWLVGEHSDMHHVAMGSAGAVVSLVKMLPSTRGNEA